MARNLKNEQYNNIMKKDSDIRMSSYIEVDRLRLKIEKLKK